MSAEDWTQQVFRFFEEQATKEQWTVETDYMLVDQVWRSKQHWIVLALEHENAEKNVNRLLEKEVAHLVDLRARIKVGIFYPSAGDERTLMNRISERISNTGASVRIPDELYMFILGFTTRMKGRPAIQFKAYILDQRGIETVHREHVILQAARPKTDQPS